MDFRNIGEKMTNTKTLPVLILSLVAILVLAGCGTQAAAEPVATQAPVNEPASESGPQAAPTETVEPISTEAPVEAPTEPAAEASAGTVSFTNDVMPIIDSRCVNCHGGERTQEGLVLTDFAGIMAGSDNGPVVMPGDPANSLLVELVANQKMPKRGPKLTPSQVQILTEWVAAGAPNN